MSQSAANLGTVTEERCALAFHRTFREVHSFSRRLVLKHIDRKEWYLRRLLGYALENQTTSEYPFVFKYSFCNDEQDGKKLRSLAAAVHLLQTSTLITDDIFDCAHLRYHHLAVHRKYNANYAFISAELLQSIALECIGSELEHHRFPNRGIVLKLFHQMVKDLYLGQYLDVYHSANLRMTRHEYLRIIKLGAGSFFANLARCGALLADKPKGVVERLVRYGYHYGMALFITDDIVDIVRKPAATGKDFATDLKGRRMRLPMILALSLSGGKDAAFLKDFLRSKDSSRATLWDVTQKIWKSGALHACRAIAKNYVDRSLKSLSGMERSLTARSLRWLSESLFRAQELQSLDSPIYSPLAIYDPPR
jgi:octaprenyl-diphosphate synthase